MRSNIVCLLAIKGFPFYRLSIHSLAHFTYRFPVLGEMIYMDSLYIIIINPWISLLWIPSLNLSFIICEILHWTEIFYEIYIKIKFFHMVYNFDYFKKWFPSLPPRSQIPSLTSFFFRFIFLHYCFLFMLRHCPIQFTLECIPNLLIYDIYYKAPLFFSTGLIVCSCTH